MPPRCHGLPTLISNKGRIRDFSGFKYFAKRGKGRRAVFGMRNQQTKRHLSIYVHRAIHILFNDEHLKLFKHGDTVDHMNRNCFDNNSTNLEWKSKSEQRRNQNEYREKYPEFRYRLHHELMQKSVDFSSREDVSFFLNVHVDLVPHGSIIEGSYLHSGWSLFTLDNSYTIHDEVWKQIKGTEMSISSFGRLQRFGRRYYPRVKEDGYCRVQIKNKSRQVHHIVLFAFGSEREAGKRSGDHVDRNRANNHIENLRWADDKEQADNRDASLYFRCRAIEAKLVDSTTWNVYKGGSKELVERFGMKMGNISGVLNPNKYDKTIKGSNGLRYHIRYAHDPTQDDLPGEEWKEIVIEDWDVGGKYYRIGEEPEAESDDAESDSD